MTKTPRQGRFLGMPYQWRRPQRGDVRRSVWNPDDERVLTPKSVGWGYNLNLHALTRRLRRR